MMTISVIVGSQLLDLRDFPMPFFDQPVPGNAGPPDGMSVLSAIASVSMYRPSSRWSRPKTLTTTRGGHE